jgi:hypothetical protein
MQKKLVYCGSLPSLDNVESFEAETCPPPPRALIPLQPGHYRFSLLAASRGMDLNIAHPGNLQAVKSGICGYRIVSVHFVLYFSSSNTVY